jgi:DNA-binding beta-propeller fold protein YncE
MITSKSLAASASIVNPAWNVANAEFLGAPINFFKTATSLGMGIVFSPDGMNLIVQSYSRQLIQYSLSIAYDLATVSFVRSRSFTEIGNETNSLFFRDDGIKLYIVSQVSDDVKEYTLSTAWDISSAVYVQAFSVSAQDIVPSGLFFKPDGTKMYVSGSIGDNVYEYDLSTAWDVSTAVFLQLLSVSAQNSVPCGLFFRADGLKMYLAGLASNYIIEYTLSTAWDVSTAAFVRRISYTAQEGSLRSVYFQSDGLTMFLFGQSNTVYKYQLSTAWSILTATFSYPTTKYLLVRPQEESPKSLFFKPDGTKMYVMGGAGRDVNEYDLSTAWAISTATFLQTFSVASQDLVTSGLFFKPDGTKMYITGGVNDSIFEYNLSTAWDVSTTVFLQSFSVAAQETNPQSVFFKPDGLKMYVMGNIGDDINEYDLSTAWDVSTAVFLQLKSISAQETNPAGLFFKPDGTKMYVVGTTGDDVNEYTLSTPWNVTTATFVRLFSFVPQGADPTGIFFRDTGLQMYISTSVPNAIIWEYDLV